ncbi:MAG: FtsX-like permease family protein, partial [Bacteroidota bacterium]
VATSLRLKSKNTNEHGDHDYQYVIGVVSDFSIGPSYQKVAPLMINLNEWSVNNVYVKINERETMDAVSQIESTWKEVFPSLAFDFTFLDQELNSIYVREVRFLSLLKVVSFLIIFITSLGIIGLISFTVEMRQKEIAIRKINGASIKSILVLLSRKFVSLLIIANVIASHIAFYFVKRWLFSYEQHIDLSLWPFLLSIVVCLAFTCLSLIHHSLEAAKTNPVESLRYE